MSPTMHALNNEEIKIILHNHYGDDNFEIINVKLLPYFDNINGFMGQHFNLVIELKRNDKLLIEKFFAKYMPSDESPFAKHMKDGNGYNKEVFFYTTFTQLSNEAIKNLNTRISPKILYVSEKRLIFEDMGLDGYKSVSFENVTPSHITKAMQVIAKFHAIGFAIENYKAKTLKCSYKLIDEYADIFNEPLFSSDVNLVPYKLSVTAEDATLDLIDFLSDKLSQEEITEFRKEYRLQFDKLTDILSNGDQKYRRIMSHGDLWLNNLIYKCDEGGKVLDCLMVDFQYLRYTPPAHDVTFTIYYNVNKEMRKKYYDHFLNTYYDTLAMELCRYDLKINEILPFKEFQESCKLYLKLATMIKAVYITINDIPQNRLQMLTSNSDDFFKFLLEDRKPLARKLMKEEPVYYNSIIQNLLDTYEEIYDKDVK